MPRMPLKKSLLFRVFNLWPPFLGAGIHIRRVSDDLREIDIEMKLRKWNTNYVGVHYGGSLYSMADPFYMLMLLENLGPDYVVWDKAASIRFRRPGRGTVRCEFRLGEAQLDEIRASLETQDKIEPVFRVQIVDSENAVVAEVEKVIYVRKKKKTESAEK